MSNTILIDTGPLVALFDRDDANHARSMTFFKGNSQPLATTLPVVTEVTHLLDFHPSTATDFLAWVLLGAVGIAEVTTTDLQRALEVMKKYADLPADFADASLVAVAERLGVNAVATFDRDFDVYRLHDRDPFVRAL